MAQIILDLKFNPLTVGGCCPPFPCDAGDKLIIFLTDPAKTLSGNGLIVADIISVTFDPSVCKFCYTISYDDALLAPGVPMITQCDIDEVCCHTCIARYVDTLDISGNCNDVLACIPPIDLAGDVGPPEPVAPGDTLSILGGNGIETTISAADTATIDIDLSADVGGNSAIFGVDTGLRVIPGLIDNLSTFQNDILNIDISTTGTYGPENIFSVVNVPNPSAEKSARVIVWQKFKVTLEPENDQAFQHQVEQSIDGGAFAFAALNDKAGNAAAVQDTWETTLVNFYNIAPGGDISITSRQTITATGNSAGTSTWLGAETTIRMIFIAI